MAGAPGPTYLFLSSPVVARDKAPPRLWAAIPGALGTSLSRTPSPGVAATPSGMTPAKRGLGGTDLSSAGPRRVFPLLVSLRGGRQAWPEPAARHYGLGARPQPAGAGRWGCDLRGGPAETRGRVQASPPPLRLHPGRLCAAGLRVGGRGAEITDLPALKIYLSFPENRVKWMEIWLSDYGYCSVDVSPGVSSREEINLCFSAFILGLRF